MSNGVSSSDGQKGSGVEYRWTSQGDINAFFGLMFDNLAGLLLLVALLSLTFGFPSEFIIRSMVPGTALGVLIGDLAFVALAIRLAKKIGRDDVTAMPLGIDTPSLFGMVFFVLGPSFVAGKEVLGLSEEAAATRTWQIGIWCLVLSGLLKLACAPICGRIRELIPRAGLLGSLAAIALVLISFMPMLEILSHPLPGLLALTVILMTLVGQIPLPGNVPGTLGALLIAGAVYYLMVAAGFDGYTIGPAPEVTWLSTDWLAAWSFGWLGALDDAIPYLPIAFPFALMTIVGGIDCTESAAAAGDDYDTRDVIAIEGVATLVAGMSGGVIQTTPYIGHPAYKAMGARAGYTFGTAIFIAAAGLLGYFGWFNHYLPIPVVLPILVFIGLEITSQSFAATPRRHYPAVALGCVPALAFLSLSLPNQLFGDPAAIAAGINAETLGDARLQSKLLTLTMLSNSFILTSLLWAWVLSSIIDRKLGTAAIVLCVAAGLTLFGVIHSPLAENRLFLPVGPANWGEAVLAQRYLGPVLEYAFGYLASAGLLCAWGAMVRVDKLPRHDDIHEQPAGLEPPLEADAGQRRLVSRVLEPEVMESFEEAWAYDQMDHAAVNRKFVDDLIAGGEVKGDIVDLGTGTALIPIELCQRVPGIRVMAIDASGAMLDLANRHLEIERLKDRIFLQQADCKGLKGFASGMADTVISNSLIHHLPDPYAAVGEAVRLLRPRGRLFVRDLVRPATQGEVDRLVDLYAGGEPEAARKMFRDSFFAALSLEEARDLFASFGLDPQEVNLSSDRHWTFDGRLKS